MSEGIQKQSPRESKPQRNGLEGFRPRVLEVQERLKQLRSVPLGLCRPHARFLQEQKSKPYI